MTKLKFLMLNFGVLLVALGTHLFRNPNHFALGGVTGIALLLSEFTNAISVGSMIFILSILSLFVGLVFMGWQFTAQSIYGTLSLSFFMWLLEIFFPINMPLTDQKLLELIFGVFVPGIGSALIFNSGSTTGGVEIIAKALEKYFHTKLTVGLLVINFFIASCTLFIFGVESCLFSILGVALYSFAVDIIIENLNTFKIMSIVCTKNVEINDYICNVLNRSATLQEARGAFTAEHKEVITTVLNHRQALKLQLFIKNIEPGAFITITNSTQIIGKGFGGFH